LEQTRERYFLEALEYEGILYAFLRRCARNSAEVEELLQEAYARLLADVESRPFNAETARECALRHARDVAVESLRGRGVVALEALADIEALNVLDEETRIDSIVGTQEEFMRLADVAAGLPEPCRRAYTLHKVYGFTPAQIAVRLDVHEATIEGYLAAAACRCADALFDRVPAQAPRPKAVRRLSRTKSS
jgi:RNA polymerase sigma factor (sigma-70 family)